MSGTGLPPRRWVKMPSPGLRRALHDPKVVHAMCEDYRAGDLKISLCSMMPTARPDAGSTVPVLVAWGAHDDIEGFCGRPHGDLVLDRANHVC